MSDCCTYMIVLYTYQTSVFTFMLLDALYIISYTRIAVSNNTVYFIVLNKFTFQILDKPFHIMCM